MKIIKQSQRHLNTRGMGILNVPGEIEKAGGKLWLSVQAEGVGNSPANWHSEFTVEEWNEFKKSLNDSGMTITDVWIDESVRRSNNMKKTIKSSVYLPTEKDVEKFVNDVNSYANKDGFDLYNLKYKSTGKMSNDGWGNEYPEFVIYDDEGTLDLFEDDSVSKYIRDKLAEKSWYAEPKSSSSDFVIAVDNDKDYLNSSRKVIKSSYEDAFTIHPWSNECWKHSDEDIGLSYAVEVYGDEFNNIDDSELEDMRDTLERYFDDESYVRDWNINNPDYQIEDAYDVISSPDELSVDELATYFDYESFGRDLRLEMNLVWDNENECWISANDFEPDDENFTFLGNSRKPVKSARFIVEDESGAVIGEADTYEEAKTLNGIIIDTQKDSIQSQRKPVKSGLSKDDLIEKINEVEPDDYSDWSTEELQELALNLGINITSSKKISNRNFSLEITKAVLSNRMTQEEAITQICNRNKCNRGFAKNILSRWIDENYETLIKSDAEIADIQNEFNVDGDLESWAEDYMPGSGKANTKGGELVRAAMRIIGEYQNNLYMIGRGYGNESVNPAARYIVEKTSFSGKGEIDDMLNHVVHMTDSEYQSWLKRFQSDFENYLRDNSGLFSEPNDDDIADYIEDDDFEFFLREFYAEDSEGNQYHFKLDEDNSESPYTCVDITFATEPLYEEGDEIEEGDELSNEIDKSEEYSEIEKDGVTYAIEAVGGEGENGFNKWKVTNVTIADQVYEIGDVIDVSELNESVTYFDNNGNTLTQDDFNRL